MAIYKVVGKDQKGKYFDDEARLNVIHYCQEKSKTPGAFIGGRAVNPDNAAFEMEKVAQLYNNDRQLRLRHSIISFDKQDNISAAQAAEIADAAIRYFGGQYQILYAIHEDTDHIHAHIVMNQVSYADGHKYHGTRKEHYDFIHYINKVSSSYQVEITPVSDTQEP